MKLRFATWNVNNRRFTKAHDSFIRSLDIDILALQECSKDFFSGASNSKLFPYCAFSLDLRPPLPDEGMSRRLGCAVLSRNKLITQKLIENVEFQERTLVCEIRFNGSAITVCSFHMPPGVNWGRVKPETFIKLADWLSSNRGSTLVGIDANAPKSDRPNIDDNEWWWDEEQIFLGKNAAHPLKDSYRVFLEKNPEIMQKIVEKFPKGPLAVSHIRGRGRHSTPCRYDFAFASPDLVVEKVRYLYRESVDAGSDHALVISDLTI